MQAFARYPRVWNWRIFTTRRVLEPLFTLKPTQRLAIKRKATLVVEASPWQPGMPTSLIGYLEAGQSIKNQRSVNAGQNVGCAV